MTDIPIQENEYDNNNNEIVRTLSIESDTLTVIYNSDEEDENSPEATEVGENRTDTEWFDNEDEFPPSTALQRTNVYYVPNHSPHTIAFTLSELEQNPFAVVHRTFAYNPHFFANIDEYMRFVAEAGGDYSGYHDIGSY